jgi:hippurate hydrolase
MFQPAEEIFEGSCDMIKDGLLTSPKVDGAMMLHVLASQPLPEGSVIISPEGVTAPAADYFTIKVKGKGCHGSMPSSGVDPIVVASHIIIALQEITSRELAINQRAIITIGCVKAGDAANVIPDVATISGSIRTYDELTRNFIKERISDISLGIASSFRANATVIYKGGCPSLYNDGKLSTAVAKYMNELIGDKAIEAKNLGTQSGGAGSEDFAYVSREVPSIMLALAAGQPKNGYLYPQHHPEVKFDESVLPIGTAAYAYTAMRWLEENN